MKNLDLVMNAICTFMFVVAAFAAMGNNEFWHDARTGMRPAAAAIKMSGKGVSDAIRNVMKEK